MVIDVVSVPLGPAEVRIARVSGCAGQPVRLSGWAVADEAPPEHERTAAAEEVRTGSGLRSLLAPLFGGELGVATSTGTNAFGEYSALPMLTVAGDQTEVRYVGAIVALTRTAWEPTELLRELEVDVRTGEVLVATATTRVLVPWAAPERLPGGISAAGGVPGQRMFSQRRPATEATSTARTRATSPPG